MPAFEFAQLFFGEFLRCDWCLAHQTGNVMEDLVMLFLLPTIILILFVYVLLKDLKILSGSKVMKLLIGLAVYLFVIFGGYYSMFAELAKTYFIILIFILGILYFVVGHFIAGPPKEGGGGGGQGLVQKLIEPDKLKYENKKELALVREEKDQLDRQIHELKNRPQDQTTNAALVALGSKKLELQRREQELLFALGKRRVY